MKIIIFIYFLPLLHPTVKCAFPATFFWKPRIGLRLGITDTKLEVYPPRKYNIEQGKVVIVAGYNLGMTTLLLTESLLPIWPNYTNVRNFHMNPRGASWYTNVYRWALRYLDLVPEWTSQKSSFADTHKVWRRRYYYIDEFIPKWVAKAIPWVYYKDWSVEEEEYKNFTVIESPFLKKMIYPN